MAFVYRAKKSEMITGQKSKDVPGPGSYFECAKPAESEPYSLLREVLDLSMFPLDQLRSERTKFQSTRQVVAKHW